MENLLPETRVVIIKTSGMSKDYYEYINLKGVIKDIQTYHSYTLYNIILDNYEEVISFHPDLVIRDITPVNLDNMFNNLDKLEEKYGKENI